MYCHQTLEQAAESNFGASNFGTAELWSKHWNSGTLEPGTLEQTLKSNFEKNPCGAHAPKNAKT